MGFFGGLLQVLVEHNRIRSREAEARLHSDKRNVYKQALGACWGLFERAIAGGRSQPAKKDLAALKDAKYEMMMFASGEVITLWNEMERTVPDDQVPPKERLLGFDRIIRAMRKDLGYDDSELAEGQLLALIIRGEDKDSLLGPP
ncbi:MAG: hypothetical protein F4Y47_20090 [Acidobacteriia bacterium]|nr:hypothetical protein [Terriglobia bacterium]MYG02552.1 hypothetical protein [Terriglobia bacterium]MYK08037.1 hypothetical protein [Terriglobia bacterium]